MGGVCVAYKHGMLVNISTCLREQCVGIDDVCRQSNSDPHSQIGRVFAQDIGRDRFGCPAWLASIP